MVDQIIQIFLIWQNFYDRNKYHDIERFLHFLRVLLAIPFDFIYTELIAHYSAVLIFISNIVYVVKFKIKSFGL